MASGFRWGFYESHDVGLEVLDRGMSAALQLLSGEFREPALDLVDP